MTNPARVLAMVSEPIGQLPISMAADPQSIAMRGLTAFVAYNQSQQSQ